MSTAFSVQILTMLHIYLEEQIHSNVYIVTGWGDESWTAFCGPAAAAVGGL
jgi:hypothetical protein